ncbi:hypothetical protein F7725_015361 [Dissostichus mawsoni]|uniref:Dual specificity protein phosphatase n=1 Tax=Dissostichus mawsoni TaxID=36200 RepID=A0A7J5YHB1_DISMA|nr:hypothetical protein F7725_015361 [Dissostichus mawsoni]
MDCPVVKRLLKDDSAKCLLLDCRSFLAFNAGHIRGAVNARCNTIVRRRAKGSVLSLDQILAGDEEVRERLRSGMYSAVVLYDERTSDSETVKEDSTLTLVLNAVCSDSSGTLIYLLKGGYDRFFSEYPEFCIKTKSLPPLTSQSSVDSSCSSWGRRTRPGRPGGDPPVPLPRQRPPRLKERGLDATGISALLNVSADCPNHFEGAYQYKCIPVEDNHKEDISCWFLEAIEFIGQCAGISRSATICLAYLMKRKRVRLDEAFEFVRRRRSIISPNFSFMGQLLQFESQLLATSCAAEAAATASPLLGPKSSTVTTVTSATPTSPFIFNFPVSVVNPAYLHHGPLTTSPGC